MKINKTDTITLRLNPGLKQKFEVAKGFLNVSDVLGMLIQDFVRDFEKQYGVIPVSLNRMSQYDIVTKMYGIKLQKDKFNELLDAYPKERTGVSIRRI